MSVSEYLPLMEPGATLRNIAVSPIVFAILPLYLLVAVGLNRYGIADAMADSSLGRLPGISAGGGWSMGVATFLYVTVAYLVILGMLGGGDTDGANQSNMGDDGNETEVAVNGGGAQETTAHETGENTADADGIEQIVSDTRSTQGLVTDVSELGNLIAFGLDTGTVVVYDDDGNAEEHSFAVDPSVSHLQVSEQERRMTVGWIDSDAFASVDVDSTDAEVFEYPAFWDVDASADMATLSAVSSPTEGPGSVGVVADGDVRWQDDFDESIGISTAITDSGSHVAVGAGHYWEGTDQQGTAGVMLYTSDGTHQWTHATDKDVISIGIDEERELVVAGTDDGQLLVLSFDGDVVWQNDEGGFLALSEDGSTVVTSEASAIIAFEVETGDEQWRADVGFLAFDDLSVSEDGTRVVAAERAAGTVAVIDNGAVIWRQSYDQGPAVGAISPDGSTWSVIVQDNDEGVAHVEVYRHSE